MYKGQEFNTKLVDTAGQVSCIIIIIITITINSKFSCSNSQSYY